MQPKYYGAAANYHRPGGFSFGNLLKIGLLALGVILLLTGGYFAVQLLTAGPKDDAARLLTRERNLYSFMANNHDKAASEDLQTATSNAMSLISSDLYGLSQGVRGLGISTIPDPILSSENDTTSAKTLQTATVQSRFDAAYWQLLRDKVAAAEQLANQLLPNASGTFKTAVQTNIDHLKTIDTKLQTFTF